MQRNVIGIGRVLIIFCFHCFVMNFESFPFNVLIILNDSSVMHGHHHIKRTFLEDVLKSSVPKKFRVRASVTNYHPRKTEDLIKVYCPECHFL